MSSRHRTKSVLTLAAVLGVVVALSGSLQAVEVVYEPFDYPAGDLNGLNGGAGFSGGWARSSNGTNPLWTVNSTGLTFPRAVAAGNSVYRPGGAGRSEANRLISGASQAALLGDNTTIWFGVLFDYTSGNASTCFLFGTDPFSVGSGNPVLAVAVKGLALRRVCRRRPIPAESTRLLSTTLPTQP